VTFAGEVYNNTFVRNNCDCGSTLGIGLGEGMGGNLYLVAVPEYGYARVFNNILCEAGSGGGLFREGDLEYASVAFNNVWGNLPGNYGYLDPQTYSAVYDGDGDQTGMNGNISENPLFLAPMSRNFRLTLDSPCVNAGTPDTSGLNLPPMDLAGNYRIWDGRVDMGCYEYGSDPYVSNPEPDIPVPPDEIMLSLFPNPVRINAAKAGYMFIEFTLPRRETENPVVQIYNLKGQKVRTIHPSQSPVALSGGYGQTSYRQGGLYSYVYDCTDDRSQKLASGIYLIRVKAGKHLATGKITIVN